MSWLCIFSPSGQTTYIDKCENCKIENCPPCPEGAVCNVSCISDPNNKPESSTFNGFPIVLFIILFVIQMSLFIIMLVVTIIILKKLTKEKKISKAMTVFIVCILLLWVLVGWYPFVGIGLFLILLVCIISLTSSKQE